MKDPIDLQFSFFMDVVPYLTEDERLTLRAGRFGMSLGNAEMARRHTGRAEYSVQVRRLLRPSMTGLSGTATAFVTRPVNGTYRPN